MGINSKIAFTNVNDDGTVFMNLTLEFGNVNPTFVNGVTDGLIGGIQPKLEAFRTIAEAARKQAAATPA